MGGRAVGIGGWFIWLGMPLKDSPALASGCCGPCTGGRAVGTGGAPQGRACGMGGGPHGRACGLGAGAAGCCGTVAEAVWKPPSGAAAEDATCVASDVPPRSSATRFAVFSALPKT